MTFEEKKTEAIARMRLLGIFPETIKQFEKDGKVSISEAPFGAYFWADEEQMAVIRKFEETYDALVYTGIHSHLREIGVMDSYLYVSKYAEEWEQDRENLKSGESIAYVSTNHDDPMLSEIGYIQFRLGPAAGLVRTA